MTTRVYLGGGGSADDEAALWRMFLRPSRRIVCWPQALPPSQYDVAETWLRLSLGVHRIRSIQGMSALLMTLLFFAVVAG